MVVGAIAALLAGGLWLWSQSYLSVSGAQAPGNTLVSARPNHPESPDVPAAATSTAAPGELRSGPTTPSAASPPPASPLPATDLPLSAIVGTLRARASAGDPQAACRLAAELERCARVGEALARIAEQTRLADETTNRIQDGATRERQRQINARSFSPMAEQALADSRQCEGVVLESSRERIDYWRQAALAGNRAALRHYAVGNAFQWRSLVETADLLPRYRAEAEEFARRAAASGDGVALLALVNAYSPVQREMSMNFLAQATAEDPVEAVALLRFALSSLPQSDKPAERDMQEALTRKLDELLPTLDAREQADAEYRQSRYLAEWARPEPPSQLELQALGRGGVGPIARELCSDSNAGAESR